MIRQPVTLSNKLGLHARAASKLVQTASRFDSDIWIHREHRRINGKSIMGVLMLAAPCGSDLELEIDGPDETQARDALVSLIEARFGEDR